MSDSELKPLDPATWVERYGDALYNFAISRVFAAEVAEDLVQETFLSALKTYQNFRGESSEKTWLIAILKRKIVDHYRRKTRDNEDLTDFEPDSSFARNGDEKGHWLRPKLPRNWSTDLNTLMDNDEFVRVFEKCLAALPPKWASCFALKNIEEMDTEQICKELDITPSNYWVILHRARLRLRECIQKNWLR